MPYKFFAYDVLKNNPDNNKNKSVAFPIKNLTECESLSCKLSYLSCPVASILMNIDMRYNADMKIPWHTARNESYTVNRHNLHF